jgi:RNA polymerase sigma-70 factor (ECF subfamily)
MVKDKNDFLKNLKSVKNEISSLAYNMAYDKSDVEDILQDAVLSAYESYGRFEKGTNFKAWISQFIVNKAYNFNTRIKKQQDRIMSYSDSNLEHTLPAKDSSNFPIKELESVSDIDDRLRMAILSLNENERTAFLLFTISGLLYREIAEKMAVPVGTVMTLIARARAKLRSILVNYMGQRSP